MSELLNKRQFYIDGKWVDPARANDLEVIDPSTEEAVAVISLGDQADTDAAVAAAKRAFPAWSATPPAERLAYVEKKFWRSTSAAPATWPGPSPMKWARPPTCPRAIRSWPGPFTPRISSTPSAISNSSAR